MFEIHTDIIAFDFWDTIVHRKCHPEQVLFEWAKLFSCKLDFEISSSDIYNARKEIEKNTKEDGIEELSYNNLIGKLYDQLVLKKIYNKEEFIKDSFNIEFLIELQNVYVDTKVIENVKQMILDKKKVIIISDFYLGYDFIFLLLKELKIEKLFYDIFISSEYGKRKSTGNLYLEVCKKLKCKPQEITMCGDNYLSDYKIPKSIGMASFHLKYQSSNKLISKNQMGIFYKKISHKEPQKNPINGYLSEILYFISELYKRATIDGKKELLFCSREGQFMKVLFENYQLMTWGKISIESKYFYVSRKAVLIPSLREINEENFDMIFRQYSVMKIGDFLKNIGMDDIFIKEYCNGNEIDINQPITSSLDDPLMNKLKLDCNFKNRYDSLRNQQKQYFLEYLKDTVENINDIALVDIGWKGTIQDCIKRILPEHISIKGYYLGLRTKEYGCQNVDSKEGILFYDYPIKSRNYIILEHEYMFYERIFVANHGPVIGYEITQEGKVYPNIINKEQELELFHFMQKYQEEFLYNFKRVLKLYKKTIFLPNDLPDLMIKNALWRVCIDYPQIWKIKELSKKKSVENFTDTHEKNIKKLYQRIIEQIKINPFFWTDYSFIYIDKLNLKFLFPMVILYCKLVYYVKQIGNGEK